MRLTPGVTIEGGQTITRQTLYDIWAEAQGAVVIGEDLAQGTFPIIVGSTVTDSAAPGQILLDQTSLLWMCYFDEIDYTGVSLWLSFGPDRFDDAFLAAEPIPPASCFKLDPSGSGRMVVRPTGPMDGSVIGISLRESTVQSGAWFPGCVEGYVKAWFPFKPVGAGGPATDLQGATADKVVLLCTWAPGGVCRTSSGENNHDYAVGKALYRVDPITTVSGGHHLERILFFGARFTNG